MENLDDQIAEVRRELQLRQYIYPKWIEVGRFSAQQAELQMKRMKAVLNTLLELKDKSQEPKLLIE